MIRMIFQRRGDKNRCGPNNPDQLTDLLNKTIADLQPSIWLAKKMYLRDPKGGRCLLRLGFPAIYQRALLSRTAQRPVSNKNDMGLEFLLTCQNQGSTKAKGFVIRKGSAHFRKACLSPFDKRRICRGNGALAPIT